jgi:hypothetical protein
MGESSVDPIDRVLGLVFDGLATDGAHHKQWVLEQIAVTLGVESNALAEFERENELEHGIAR